MRYLLAFVILFGLVILSRFGEEVVFSNGTEVPAFLHGAAQGIQWAIIIVALSGVITVLWEVYDRYSHRHPASAAQQRVVASSTLSQQPEVAAVQQRLEAALAEATAENDERWVFDAGRALHEYLPDVIEKHQQQGYASVNAELLEALRQVEEIGTHGGRTGERARREWGELKTFLDDREKSVKALTSTSLEELSHDPK